VDNLIKKELSLDSREVAEMVGKQHKELLRDIRTYKEYLRGSNFALSDYFIASTYVSEQNKELPNYQITKKGCEFIAHKLTGQKGAIFTATYINKFHEMESVISNKVLSPAEIMRIQLNMIDDVSDRVEALENTMVIDYGQQKVLGNKVNAVVIDVLGGKNSAAYKEIGKKVFAECNRDIKDRFNVNARGNIARLDFNKACEYIENWAPCTNTRLLIEDCNSQMSF
jgi:Rha family phage regulatory protein